MPTLSKLEEQILLGVLRLGDDAYAIPIRNYLKEVIGEKLSIGGIYVPLDRLVRKGFLTTFQSDPIPERGGMSRRYYKLTSDGMIALEKAREIHNKLWEGIEQLKYSPEREK
jgi:PadR family transcriptional regulator PadR